MSELRERDSKGVKIRTGHVVSAKMDKTIVVAVEQQIRHSRFRKYIRKRTKLYAHDKDNKCQEGDLVEIIESRPLSKKKQWRVRQILKKAETA